MRQSPTGLLPTRTVATTTPRERKAQRRRKAIPRLLASTRTLPTARATRSKAAKAGANAPAFFSAASAARGGATGTVAGMTLEEVVEWYDKGGHPNPHLDQKVKPLKLTAEEKADLVAFMHALTGAFPMGEYALMPISRMG